MQQAQTEGITLRYPGELGHHASLSHEQVATMLMRATHLAVSTPFVWSYIDRPTDGQLYLIFVPSQLPFPTDGLRYQEQEQRYVIPVGQGREMEVGEIKFGFIPNLDASAYRIRRRYRFLKGGHPQLYLVHYSRGQSIAIIPSLNQPTRAYPLRTPNEAAVYVIGDKTGQKVYNNPGGPSAGGPLSGSDRPQSMGPGGLGGMGMNFGIGMGGNPQAMLSQQNSAMEALERRTQRDRNASMAGQRAQQPRIDDDDSADEADTISTRTLALTRYRRNHEFMNEVFMYAAFGNLKEAPPHKAAYSKFKKDDLETRVAKLTAEVEELQAKAAARREAKANEEVGDVSMESLTVEQNAP